MLSGIFRILIYEAGAEFKTLQEKRITTQNKGLLLIFFLTKGVVQQENELRCGMISFVFLLILIYEADEEL